MGLGRGVGGADVTDRVGRLEVENVLDEAELLAGDSKIFSAPEAMETTSSSRSKGSELESSTSSSISEFSTKVSELEFKSVADDDEFCESVANDPGHLELFFW